MLIVKEDDAKKVMYKTIVEHKTYSAQSQKSIRTRRKRKLTLLLLVLIAVSAYAGFISIKPLPAVSFTPITLQSASVRSVPISWPASAQMAVGSVEEGIVAQSATQFNQIPMASTAKVITALAVMRAKPFRTGVGETLNLTSTDLELYNYYVNNGGSVAAVSPGEEISQKDAITTMLLPSANNMADSLAIWAFGSMDNYITYAQKMLKDYGAFQTTVHDASGFSPETTSTAHDLLLLGQRLMKDPILKSIVGMREATVPVAGQIKNTNQLLDIADSVGIKTGHTNEAGGCLLFAQSYSIEPGHTITLLSAILGATTVEDSFTYTSSLISTTKLGMRKTIILPVHTEVGSYKTVWGQSSRVYTKSALVRYGWTESKWTIQTTAETLKLPANKGYQSGTVTASTDTNTLSTPLITESILSKPSFWWRLLHNE